MKPATRYLLLALLAIIAWPGGAMAQEAAGERFPVIFGPTNLGKEFYFSFPTNYEDQSAAQQYIRLYITAPVRTRVEIWTGPVLKKTLYTVANDVITFDLTKFEAQAVSRANNAPIPPDQVYRRKAVRIIAESPIVVYGMNRTSYTSDGMLLLPTNALGRDYVVASATDVITGYYDYLLPSQYLVVGAHDNTNVSIYTPWETPNHREGEIFTVQLNKGDVFSSMSVGGGGDLSGAIISANNPVAVLAGQNCTFLPDYRFWACDHLEEMMFPVSAWGTIYHAVPFATRLKGDMFRIFASEDNTDIFINGTKIATLSQRGGPQGIGWINYLPPDRNQIEFTSNKPIYVAQYNNSQQYDNVQSDPFYLVLTPVEQYQTSFVFSTPAADFPQNYINLVADSSGYDKIEIAVAGTEDWKNLSRTIPRVARPFPTQINGVTYVGLQFDILPGTYKMRGPKPFAAYIYGFGTYDSYGYPLSAAVADLQKPDTVAPKIEKEIDCYGTVNATITDLPDDITIRSNLASIDLDPFGSYNYALTPLTELQPGISVGADVRLTVVDPKLDAQAVLVMSDMRGNISLDTIFFAAFNVVAEPSPIDFGTMFIGGSADRTTTLRNLSKRPVVITELALKQNNAGFSILGPAAPINLAAAGEPNDRITVQLRFDGTANGDFTDSLGIRDECGFRYVAELDAHVGTPIIHVTNHDFEAWPVAAPPRVSTIEIQNISTGSGTLIVTGVAKPITDGATFLLPNGLPAFPLTLAPGRSQAITVAFDPSAVQTYRDEIVFSHNAPPNPLNDSTGELTGRGIQGTLIATDFDWGRHRVGTGPHTGTVTLTNIGTSDVQLSGVESTTGNTGDFEVINPAAITGTTLKPNESVTLDVTFTPSATGPRQMTVVYGHLPRQDEPVESHLSGFGTIPGLVTSDYDFGSMDVNSTPEVQRRVVFRLPAPQVPDVIDSVTIVRFDRAGDPDFRMDPVTDLPIVLKRGGRESVEFIAYFGAQQAGNRSQTATAITLDGVDATSRWTGVGISKNATVQGTGVDFGLLCTGERTLEALVWNGGDAPLTISAVTLENLPPDFVMTPVATPLTLQPGDTLRIPITYTSGATNAYTGILRIANSSANNPDLELSVRGSSVAQLADASVHLVGNVTSTLAEFGRDVMTTVRLDDAITQGLALRNYRVRLMFDARHFKPDVTRVVAGSANPGATVTVFGQTAGEVVFDVASSTPVVAGDLLTLPLIVVFDSALTRGVRAEITTTDAECLTFQTAPATVNVQPICGLSERLIELSSTIYKLGAPSPNPVTRTTTIEYSLGLDGHTTLVLQDARGNVIQTLVDEHRQPATYAIEIDASQLPSGLYYYTLTSGAWKQTGTMNVAK